MITVQTVRLYPTMLQTYSLNQWMWCARRIWNHFLEHRIKAYKRRKESVSCFDQNVMLTKWRAGDARIKAMPVNFQRDAIDRLAKAFNAFFSRCQSGEKPGFPRFKGRGRWRSLNCGHAYDYIREDRILVPKLGLIRCRNLRPTDGTVKGLRIVKRADRWFAQLLIDDGKAAPAKLPVQSSIGIDVGLESFATLSNGEQIDNPRFTRKLAKKLGRAQRVVSRRQKRSKRRERAKLRVAKIHLKIANSRKDFAHKLSKTIVSKYDLIAVEKLNVKGMARGHFAKSIHDAAWSNFIWDLTYKAERAGKSVVSVDPRGTSQTCSSCGSHCPKTLKDRWHGCQCGLSVDRDHNAAINILARAVPPVGRGFTHGETPPSGRSPER